MEHQHQYINRNPMYYWQTGAGRSSSGTSSLSSPSLHISSKRSSSVLYHPTLFNTHTTLGQTGSWCSTNPLAKRAKFETAANLPQYPQRPGEKDCAHYMLTRTCKFGDTCKFDHPIWVPQGGIPDWKEVPITSSNEPPPERPGEPDCPYFLKTQRCKYGSKCKFNHPKDKMVSGGAESTDFSSLPDRPSEPSCAFYMKTGKCKFGASCKFHHPKDILVSLAGQESGNEGLAESVVKSDNISGEFNVKNTPYSVNQALFHNSKGLPIRLGEVDCPFYMKTFSCKYGTSCCYNHPDGAAINVRPAILASSSAYNLDIGIVNPTISIHQTIDTRLPQSKVGVRTTVYPQRPGLAECEYYMKTGECKYGERCRFHHPIDQSAPAAKQTEQNIKLPLARLPRREGAVHCPYYMKTGTCKYGGTCKFDHPPSGEMKVGASEGMMFIFNGEGETRTATT